MNVDSSTLDAKALSAHAANVHSLQGCGVGGFVPNIIPMTSFDPPARNDVLPVLCFAVLFCVSLSLAGEFRAQWDRVGGRIRRADDPRPRR
jgi:aerobic C4-dicarboxylate transport protein